jgi:hypothetical protein
MGAEQKGRSMEEITQERVQRDPEFARRLIRDVIKGSIGYAELSRRTGTPQKCPVRMFGASGNPTAAKPICRLDSYTEVQRDRISRGGSSIRGTQEITRRRTVGCLDASSVGGRTQCR